MMYMVMNMMISYTNTLEEPTDYYMLCVRVGELEQDIITLRKEVKDLTEELKSMKYIPSYKELVQKLEIDN